MQHNTAISQHDIFVRASTVHFLLPSGPSASSFRTKDENRSRAFQQQGEGVCVSSVNPRSNVFRGQMVPHHRSIQRSVDTDLSHLRSTRKTSFTIGMRKLRSNNNSQKKIIIFRRRKKKQHKCISRNVYSRRREKEREKETKERTKTGIITSWVRASLFLPCVQHTQLPKNDQPRLFRQ